MCWWEATTSATKEFISQLRKMSERTVEIHCIFLSDWGGKLIKSLENLTFSQKGHAKKVSCVVYHLKKTCKTQSIKVYYWTSRVFS